MGTALQGQPPTLPVACWRVKHDRSKRLALSDWTDGALDPEVLAEYTRLGWTVEYAHPAAVAARLAEDRARLRGLLEELIDEEGPQPGHVEWYRKVQAELVRLQLEDLPCAR